jgi:hypothetical protein
MVSKPDARFRLPNEPLPALRLVEASVALWRATLRQTFAPALLCGIAALLPGLALGDLPMQLARQWLVSLSTSSAPLLQLLPVDGLSQALPTIAAWVLQPAIIALLVGTLLLGLVGAARIVQRQQEAALAGQARLAGNVRRHFVASFCAWLIYTSALLACVVPLLALWIAIFVAVSEAGPSLFAALLLLIFLVGSLLLSAPLAWASVALGLSPYCAVADGRGSLRAQRDSIALVRGRWTHAAIVISVPMFFYLGASSVISSSIMTVAGVIAVVNGGWMALLDPAWLVWSQLLALVPTALVAPLAFAGGVLCRNDLSLRQSAPKHSELTAS